MKDLQPLSQDIENLLVARNLRGMQQLQKALRPGYYLRAARILNQCQGMVFIGTGFPVADTFETDGPVGAIALYQCLEQMGAHPVLVCGDPLYRVLKTDYRCHPIPVFSDQDLSAIATEALQQYRPQAVVSIERPGLAASDRYYNMRGEDITERCASFDYFLKLAACPTIAIGDGGNEIGMGNIKAAVSQLNITPAETECDELLLADVSNWGAYGLIALLSVWRQHDYLATVDPMHILQYLSDRGSVDGVSRLNTLTEDSLDASEGIALIQSFRALCGFS
jgi:hypothetical protein